MHGGYRSGRQQESKMAQKLASWGQKIVTKGPVLATKYGFQAMGK